MISNLLDPSVKVELDKVNDVGEAERDKDLLSGLSSLVSGEETATLVSGATLDDRFR